MKKEDKAALRRAMLTLARIEDLIYIVAINGPEIQQQARLTLARFSRALAEAGGALVDAYSLSGVALRWRTFTAEGTPKWVTLLRVFTVLSSLAALLSWVRYETLPATVFALMAAICAVALNGRHVQREAYEGVAGSANDQLLDFERMMLWLGFDTTSLGAMKHSLPEFRSWESLRAWAALRLEVCALSILIAKNPAAGPPLTDEERTLVVRRKEDDFFPFHRRLAACGLADQKVDGYFDRARAKIEKVPAESLVIV